MPNYTGLATGAPEAAATTAESPTDYVGLQRLELRVSPGAAIAPDPSAQADITFSLPRIHSPRLGPRLSGWTPSRNDPGMSDVQRDERLTRG
ncbi:MAG TPA: hypothetical protein VF142_18765 [Longimicrobium sp.]